jgi:carbonic anhydrase
MPDHPCIPTEVGRRQFLHKIISGAAAGVAASAALGLYSPATLDAQTNLTPDAVMRELLDGNQRFAANKLTSIEHDLAILK